MTLPWKPLTIAFLLAGSAAATARSDIDGLDRGMAGPRAEVLVLGSVHLSGLPEDFDAKTLQPLLDRLAAFQPEVITIEAISGEDCDLLARFPDVYDPTNVGPYCASTDAARAATGLDVPAAIAAVQRTLRTWPAQPTPAQRRQLAATFLAANDRASALTQWWQLPAAERRAGDGLDASLVALLQKMETRRNEDYQIAARLAARLGHARVAAADDHTGDNIAIDDEKAFEVAIRAAWDAGRARAKAMREREEALKRAGDMLALYRYINRPDVLRLAIESDFGAALKDASPQHYGQRYVAGWETRNLRMVSNVRAAFRDRPGARVLAIVGSSHKPRFDTLLGQMQGVDVVDAQKALGP